MNEQAFLGTKEAHIDGGVPNIVITIDKMDAYHFGYLVYFFEIACAMCLPFEANPIQPNCLQEKICLDY